MEKNDQLERTRVIGCKLTHSGVRRPTNRRTRGSWPAGYQRTSTSLRHSNTLDHLSHHDSRRTNLDRPKLTRLRQILDGWVRTQQQSGWVEATFRKKALNCMSVNSAKRSLYKKSRMKGKKFSELHKLWSAEVLLSSTTSKVNERNEIFNLEHNTIGLHSNSRNNKHTWTETTVDAMMIYRRASGTRQQYGNVCENLSTRDGANVMLLKISAGPIKMQNIGQTSKHRIWRHRWKLIVGVRKDENFE